ncbi:unnamed protein product [Lactuca virosa]|uniref:Amino acid transporter transmembrane domain-containing protein n=1 Tax=Lactuca virosa TaxID=75947 RepID=A0AAU9LSX3_9ASTR|nr:unnamed protein product [Lactuca virosa]
MESGADARNDRRTAEEKAIDDWLPVTSSRNAKWWYSAFHNVTAMVGAGVLSLPYALSQLGWGFGITVLVLSWVITLYTLWQMVEMHEMVPGKRFDRYHELGQHAFGEKLGLYVVVPQQLIVEVGTCIVYMVTGGKSLQKFQQSICPDCKPLRTTYFILIFASVHFVLAHLPNFNSISGVSLAAAIMSLRAVIQRLLGWLHGKGELMMMWTIVQEIQATIPSTPEKPSKGPMWLGCVVAYIIVAICYFPVAIIGFYVFGNTVDDNILITLEHPPWLIASANMFVIIHVIGGYQIFSMPVYDMIETFLVKSVKLKPSGVLRFTVRTLFVVITTFIAITFPFFGGLLGFFGGFALAPTTYYLPCIIWLIVRKPKRWSITWCINWICIVIGVLIMILAPIGGLRIGDWNSGSGVEPPSKGPSQ